MKIRNIEIDFDFLDADNMERFENEAQKVIDKSNTLKIKKMPMSEAIRKECEIIEDFFDSVFGEGISDKVFNGRMNLNEHIKIFQDIAEEKIRVEKDFEDLSNKYKPNREERRNNKFNHKRKGR